MNFNSAVIVFTLISTALLNSSSSIAQTQNKNAFPIGPNLKVTPGSLCIKPTSKRYPEGIPYCERNVESESKKEIIKNYDRLFGYKIGTMKRELFKIDHYIPLCMGGSNNDDNLWPQHESVYKQTDLLEDVSCKKMAEGKLRQKDAVNYIKTAKNNLPKAKEILKRLQSL